MKAIYYKTSSGYVTKAIEGPEGIIELNKDDEESIIEGELAGDPADYVVIDGVLQLKLSFEISVNGTAITGIPPGTFVTVGFQSPVLVNDGSVELEAQYSQEVLVCFENPAYLPMSIKVTL